MAIGGGMVGGPRQYEGPTLGAVSVWKCPACGVENSSVFEDGCPSCGAGSAKARHVGHQPPPTVPRSATAPNAEDAAFAQWITAYPSVTSPQMRELLREAWRAAVAWARGTVIEIPATDDVPRVLVPRALLAKVIAVLDVTFDLPEEQQSDDLRFLIAQLKELND
jgi:hypothetical protein